MNRRFCKRIDLDIPVTAHTPNRGPFPGRVINMSESGAAFLCDRTHALELFTVMDFVLPLPILGKPERAWVKGFLVRKQQGLVGILFMQDLDILMLRIRDDLLSAAAA